MRRSLLVFLLVFSMVIYVNLPLITGGQNETFQKTPEPEVFVGDPITPYEVNSFLEIWPDYVGSWVSKFGVSQLSLTNSRNIEKKLPYITIIWLNRRGWEAERFFYVEQRLKSIVRSAKTEEHVAKTIEMLEKKLRQEHGSAAQNIQSMIEYHKKSLNVEKVSKAEIEMVRPNLAKISQVLEVDGAYNK